MTERDQITELEHRIGQAAEEAESMALEGGVARACALRFLGALQVPEAEWPAAPATGPLVLPPDEFAAAMRAVAAALGYRAEAVTIDSAAPGTQAPAPASPGPATAATDAAGGILVPDRETLREAVSAAIDAGWWSQGPAPSERVMQIVWPLLADRGRAEGAIVHAALDRATERMRAAEGKLAEMTADLRALAEGCADLASNGRDLDRNCTASSAYRDVASDITAIIGTGEGTSPLSPAQCDRLRQMVSEYQDAISAVRAGLEMTAALDDADRAVIAAARDALRVLEGAGEADRG